MITPSVKPTYSVLIIGCGNIAGGFDFLRSSQGEPLTHAGAYLQHGGFVIGACLDSSLEKLKKFQNQWNISSGLQDFSELDLKNESFDVVSICSPSHLHTEHIELALKLNPKVIFCEKPLTVDESGGVHQVELCQRQGVALVVNYNRRWDPVVENLFRDLKSGCWGKIRSVVAHYNKGILNNGSHMIELLIRLLGSLNIVSVSTPIFDFSVDDPTIAAMLTTANRDIPIYLNPLHANDYSCFELDIHCESGTLSMKDGGMIWCLRHVVPNTNFQGYKILGQPTWLSGGYGKTMGIAVDNIYRYLSYGAPISMLSKDVLDVQDLCFQIKKLAFKNFQPQLGGAKI